MENPYAASIATVEPAAPGQKRLPVWKSLLIAYLVHHVAGVLGFSAAFIYTNGVSLLFGSLKSVVFVLAGIPVCDLYLVIEPLGAGEIVPETYVGLRWLRSLVVLSVLTAIVAYSATRHRGWLWYVAIVTFLLFVSLVLSRVADRNAVGAPPGPGLVPAKGLISFPRSAWERAGRTLCVHTGRGAAGLAFPRGAWERGG